MPAVSTRIRKFSGGLKELTMTSEMEFDVFAGCYRYCQDNHSGLPAKAALAGQQAVNQSTRVSMLEPGVGEYPAGSAADSILKENSRFDKCEFRSVGKLFYQPQRVDPERQMTDFKIMQFRNG